MVEASTVDHGAVDSEPTHGGTLRRHHCHRHGRHPDVTGLVHTHTAAHHRDGRRGQLIRQGRAWLDQADRRMRPSTRAGPVEPHRHANGDPLTRGRQIGRKTAGHAMTSATTKRNQDLRRAGHVTRMDGPRRGHGPVEHGKPRPDQPRRRGPGRSSGGHAAIDDEVRVPYPEPEVAQTDHRHRQPPRRPEPAGGQPWGRVVDDQHVGACPLEQRPRPAIQTTTPEGAGHTSSMVTTAERHARVHAELPPQRHAPHQVAVADPWSGGDAEQDP